MLPVTVRWVLWIFPFHRWGPVTAHSHATGEWRHVPSRHSSALQDLQISSTGYFQWLKKHVQMPCVSLTKGSYYVCWVPEAVSFGIVVSTTNLPTSCQDPDTRVYGSAREYGCTTHILCEMAYGKKRVCDTVTAHLLPVRLAKGRKSSTVKAVQGRWLVSCMSDTYCWNPSFPSTFSVSDVGLDAFQELFKWHLIIPILELRQLKLSSSNLPQVPSYHVVEVEFWPWIALTLHDPFLPPPLLNQLQTLPGLWLLEWLYRFLPCPWS